MSWHKAALGRLRDLKIDEEVRSYFNASLAYLDAAPPWLGRALVGIAILLTICILWPTAWGKVIIPLVTPAVIGAGAYAALKQAEVARERHKEQTDADRQRRLTESYSKAIEQLASDKMAERVGGIYTLEQISKESPSRYWTVMETLTAFVRERSRQTEAERSSQPFEQRVSQRAYFLWLEAGQPEKLGEHFWANAVNQDRSGEPPPTDIAAVLTVIKRRSEENRDREHVNAWRLDFHEAVLFS